MTQPTLPTGETTCPNCRTAHLDGAWLFGCDHCGVVICDDCAVSAEDCDLRHCWGCVSDDGECRGAERERARR